jgi:L-aspartate oxidase
MRLDTDFLVIGSGLAGLNAALQLAEHGRVLLVTKRRLGDSATSWAQGGLASVVGPDDSIEAHVQDTLTAGAGLCDEQVVRSTVADGPRAVERLTRFGVAFDRHGDAWDLTREGGHSARRILHSSDVTGREIDRALRECVERTTNVTHLTDHIAIDLITLKKLGRAEERCIGAHVLDTATGHVKTVRAKATLLATGGAGKVYLYTSNPDVATGDGVAMAFRAGAVIANMEFFQFHPTCLFHPHAKSFLISEALRGEGGILRRQQDGRAFMGDLHPLKDLAPRDIVARAIDREMKRSGADYVQLDMTGNDPAFIASRFPNIHTACLALGIDMTKQPIPVVPAAHYLCGGVWTDLGGATSIPGLWAAGETACTGLHGANRLASNSLLEAAVFSERAARGMVGFAREAEMDASVPEWDPGDAVDPDEEVIVSNNWDELRRTMWNYVGIVRSDKRLARAQARARLLLEEIDEYYWRFKVTLDLIELRNLAAVGSLIVASAQHRRESRGLHYNIDTQEASTAPRSTYLKRSGRDAIVWLEKPGT